MSVVTTHELAHRIDSQFVKVDENEGFRQKVAESKKLIDAAQEKFRNYCRKHDEDGFLSDICSAVCEGKYEFPQEHDKRYWQIQGNKEKEIFANYYSLKAFKDTDKINFLKENLPEIFQSCDDFVKQLHGEEN